LGWGWIELVGFDKVRGSRQGVRLVYECECGWDMEYNDWLNGEFKLEICKVLLVIGQRVWEERNM
jgi:hypothetical protein